MRRVLVPKARLALLATLLLAGPAATASAAIPGASACPKAATFACSTVTVPLDRTGADAGTVALKVRTLAATSTPGARVALIPLAGGPGQAAIPIAKDFATSLAPGLTTRDLVVFDQRGTGSSGPLSCGLSSAASDNEADAARRCALKLGRKRAHYTTLDSVADIEAIRVAGGYDKVALYGVSYGTKVALDYAATYPDRVDRLVLDSVVTPEGPDPLQLSTFRAVPRVLAQLCAGRCSGITTNPGRDVATLVKRLSKRSLTGRYVDIRGRGHTVAITRNGLLSLLVAGDLNPQLRAGIPAAVRGALRGDTAPLARLRVRSVGGAVATQRPSAAEDEGVNQTLFVTTSCEEFTFPWNRMASAATRARQAAGVINRLPAAKLAPFDRDTAFTGGLLPLCVKWPVASLAPPASFTLPTTVPTLLVEGQQDLRTPVEDSLALAPRLGPATQVLQVPYTGHSVVGTDVSRCAERAVGAFLADGSGGDCSAVKPLVGVVRIASRDVRTLPATGRVTGLPGETITAMLRTLQDASEGLNVARFDGRRATALGGLRAGTLRVVSGGLRLRNYSYVPGVLVSGLVPNSAAKTATLTLAGARAAHGTIKLNDRTLTGRLGGRRIALKARARAASASAGAAGWAGPWAAGPRAPLPRQARIP